MTADHRERPFSTNKEGQHETSAERKHRVSLHRPTWPPSLAWRWLCSRLPLRLRAPWWHELDHRTGFPRLTHTRGMQNPATCAACSGTLHNARSATPKAAPRNTAKPSNHIQTSLRTCHKLSRSQAGSAIPASHPACATCHNNANPQVLKPGKHMQTTASCDGVPHRRLATGSVSAYRQPQADTAWHHLQHLSRGWWRHGGGVSFTHPNVASGCAYTTTAYAIGKSASHAVTLNRASHKAQAGG